MPNQKKAEKYTAKEFTLNWASTTSKEQSEIMERAKRALKHAIMQKEFWADEVEFWRKRAGEKVYQFFMKK